MRLLARDEVVRHQPPQGAHDQHGHEDMDHDPEIIDGRSPPLAEYRRRTRTAKDGVHPGHAVLAWHATSLAGFERDPLSVRYDPAARRFVGRVLGAWDGGRNGGWVTTLVAAPSERAASWARALGIDVLRIRYTGRGSGIETMYEAAFRRACYWDDRVYLWDKHGGDWSARDRPVNPHRVAA